MFRKFLPGAVLLLLVASCDDQPLGVMGPGGDLAEPSMSVVGECSPPPPPAREPEYSNMPGVVIFNWSCRPAHVAHYFKDGTPLVPGFFYAIPPGSEMVFGPSGDIKACVISERDRDIEGYIGRCYGHEIDGTGWYPAKYVIFTPPPLEAMRRRMRADVNDALKSRGEFRVRTPAAVVGVRG